MVFVWLFTIFLQYFKYQYKKVSQTEKCWYNNIYNQKVVWVIMILLQNITK